VPVARIKPATKWQRDVAYRLAEMGSSQVALADAMEIDGSTLYRWLAKSKTAAHGAEVERGFVTLAARLAAKLVNRPAAASETPTAAGKVAEPEARPYGAPGADLPARCAENLEDLRICIRGLDARLKALEHQLPGEEGGLASDGRP
jgi:hypothetical protein